MEKLKTRLDHLAVGLVAGLIGPGIGFCVFYLILFNHKPFTGFVQMIVSSPATHSSILALSLIANLGLFFIALRNDWYRAARGVIFATLLYAPFVVYFKYA